MSSAHRAAFSRWHRRHFHDRLTGGPVLLEAFTLGAPCFSRGSWTLVQRNAQPEKMVASATGTRKPSAKARFKMPSRLRSAEALLPRINARAPTKKRKTSRWRVRARPREPLRDLRHAVPLLEKKRMRRNNSRFSVLALRPLLRVY